MYAGEAYRPGPSPARFTALSVIAAAHGFMLAAITLLGGTQAVIEKARPVFVRFVAPEIVPPSPPVAARIPLPRMRTPEIQVPLPVIETIAVQLEERPAAIHAAPPNATLVAEAPKAAAAPAEPPRYDMAYLNNPQPEYPPLSKRLREQGRVLLRVLVNASGLVEEIEVKSGSGYVRLDDAALVAVRRWKFAPARANGQAVAGWAVVPIAFNLQG
jgi:protein TonB